MAFVSVAEAAKLIGRHRNVLYRDYVATGKLSVTKDARGRIQIDTSELLRVFGSFVSVANEAEKSAAMLQNEAEKEAADTVEKLRAEVEILRERLAARDEKIAAQAANLDDLRGAIKLLEHKQAKRRWWPF